MSHDVHICYLKLKVWNKNIIIILIDFCFKTLFAFCDITLSILSVISILRYIVISLKWLFGRVIFWSTQILFPWDILILFGIIFSKIWFFFYIFHQKITQFVSKRNNIISHLDFLLSWYILFFLIFFIKSQFI